MRRRFLHLLLLFTVCFSFSYSRAEKISVYVAASSNYSGLGAARIGIGDWEVGLLSRWAYGVDKVFRFNDETLYTSFGLALSSENMPGFFGSIGFNWDMFLGIGLRGELWAVQTIGGFSRGSGQLGLSWNF